MRSQIIRSLYLENVSRFAHSPSSGWYPVGRMQYAPTRDLKKSMRFQDQSCTRSTSPASAEALIFFCLLFFHQGKAPTGAGKFFPGTFSRSIMYPINFLGLGRGLDFLLSSFLSSRKEKKVGAWGQSPRFLYHKINISGKRDTFWDYLIVISRKRTTFCAFIIIKMVFGGTYSSCLYLLFLS